jgi:predicted RNA-binding protein YlqC (UPF0109 family)
MSEIDQQFIEYVVKSLVGNPEAVHIDRRIDEKGVLLELTVDPEDLGRVIGKRGATAQSLRTLLRALGTKNDARYNLKIIDNGPLDRGQASDDKAPPAKSEPADEAAADDSATKDSADDTSDNTDDTEATDEKAAPAEPEEPAATEEPEPEPEVDVETSNTSADDQTSDRLAQARKELADLDDLDL